MIMLALKLARESGGTIMSVRRIWRSLYRSVAAALIIFAPFAASAPKEGQFDNRDLSGVWWVDSPGPDKLFDRAKNGDAGKCQTCHISEHSVPEPPLTLWARQHLMTQPQMIQTKTGKCDPIGVPAQFWYTELYPFEFVVTQGRIFQFFEKQNEWRVIELNRGDSKELRSTHMGESVGNWDGNTLLVDTIGYNGQNLIEPVGVNHRMSPAFHLVERWQRLSPNELELDATYYDEIAWGNQPWGGLKKKFTLQPKLELLHTPCSPEANRKFDDRFVNPSVPPL
jgi:hypothetical protein